MGLNSMRVLVTPTSFGQTDPSLKEDLETAVGAVEYNRTGRPLTEAELLKKIPAFDACIAGLDPFTEKVIQAAERLKVISRYGVGVDAVDLVAAEEQGIIVTNTPGANAGAVAELAVGLMLALARQIPAAVTATREGGWPRINGVSLEGKTVGLVGFGAIGRVVAQRLQGFDCQVVAFDPVASKEAADRLGVTLQPLSNLLPQVDFLSLHCPLLPETRAMVDRTLLSQMKPTAYLINTARGEIIDEAALVEALDRGLIRGAALDVFVEQPPPRDNPLLNHPRVLATHHMGAHTDGAKDAMGRGAFQNCLAVLRGETPPNRVI